MAKAVRLPRAEHPARKIMKQTGLQVSKMAELLGISQPSLTRILTGKTKSTPEIDEQLRAVIFMTTGRKLPMQTAPKILLKRHEEVEGVRLVVDPDFIQVNSKYLQEPLLEPGELMRQVEEYEAGKTTLPEMYVLRWSGKSMALLKGQVALMAHKRSKGSRVATCYQLRVGDIDDFAGFAPTTKGGK